MRHFDQISNSFWLLLKIFSISTRFLFCNDPWHAQKKSIITGEFPYHITARCINRDWFRLPLPVVWRIFSDQLFLVKQGFGFEILSFVLMDNHFHMLVRAPRSNLSAGMHYLLMNVSKEITALSGRINQTFAGPYHPSLIDDPEYNRAVYKYIYRNPVDAGLAARVEEYPYSTLFGLLGLGPSTIPLIEDTFLFENTFQTLSWLNHEEESDKQEAIRLALRKPTFKLSSSKRNRKKPLLT